MKALQKTASRTTEQGLDNPDAGSATSQAAGFGPRGNAAALDQMHAAKSKDKGGGDEDKTPAEGGGGGGGSGGGGAAAAGGGDGGAPPAGDGAEGSGSGIAPDDVCVEEPLFPVCEAEEEAPGQQALSGPAYAPQCLRPNYILDWKVSGRSNTKSSTQSASDPTMKGHAAIDQGAKVWRFQLDDIESKGKIRIVYYTSDHYPAPTPADDTGPLTNVTQANWATIVADLDAQKAAVAGAWSAYRAEDVHELYHWEVEWQGEVNKEAITVCTDMRTLQASFTQAPDEATARALLEPRAKTLFDTAMGRARTAYDALGDSDGDPPYKQQVPVVEALIKRVRDHAKAKGWP